MILYKCDPNINETCVKTGCQTVCFLTRNKDYAARTPDGSPIISYGDGYAPEGDGDEQAAEKEEV